MYVGKQNEVQKHKIPAVNVYDNILPFQKCCEHFLTLAPFDLCSRRDQFITLENRSDVTGITLNWERSWTGTSGGKETSSEKVWEQGDQIVEVSSFGQLFYFLHRITKEERNLRYFFRTIFCIKEDKIWIWLFKRNIWSPCLGSIKQVGPRSFNPGKDSTV
jgi:hypothetical protein